MAAREQLVSDLVTLINTHFDEHEKSEQFRLHISEANQPTGNAASQIMRDDLAHVIRAVEQGEQEIRLKAYISKLLTKLTDLICAHQVMNVKLNDARVEANEQRTIKSEYQKLQGSLI